MIKLMFVRRINWKTFANTDTRRVYYVNFRDELLPVLENSFLINPDATLDSDDVMKEDSNSSDSNSDNSDDDDDDDKTMDEEETEAGTAEERGKRKEIDASDFDFDDDDDDIPPKKRKKFKPKKAAAYAPLKSRKTSLVHE